MSNSRSKITFSPSEKYPGTFRGAERDFVSPLRAGASSLREELSPTKGSASSRSGELRNGVTFSPSEKYPPGTFRGAERDLVSPLRAGASSRREELSPFLAERRTAVSGELRNGVPFSPSEKYPPGTFRGAERDLVSPLRAGASSRREELSGELRNGVPPDLVSPTKGSASSRSGELPSRSAKSTPDFVSPSWRTVQTRKGPKRNRPQVGTIWDKKSRAEQLKVLPYEEGKKLPLGTVKRSPFSLREKYPGGLLKVEETSDRQLIVLDIFGLFACRQGTGKYRDSIRNSPSGDLKSSISSIKQQQRSRLLNIYRSCLKESSPNYRLLFSRKGLLSLKRQSAFPGEKETRFLNQPEESILKSFCHQGDVKSERSKQRTGRYIYSLRPFTFAFLRWCDSLKEVDVAFLSSTTEVNASPVIKRLKKETGTNFIFVGFRDSTSPDPEYPKFKDLQEKPIESYDTIKDLNHFLDEVRQKTGRSYTLGQTLILDDSPLKMRFNPLDSVVIVPEVTSSNLRPRCTAAEHVEANCFPYIAAEICERFKISSKTRVDFQAGESSQEKYSNNGEEKSNSETENE